MRVIAPALVLAVTVALGSLGCWSSDPPIGRDAGAGDAATGGVGSMSLTVTVASIVSLGTASYTITGPDYTHTGTIDVGTSTARPTVLGGLPSGDVYSVAAHAMQVDGGATCAGSANFAVTVGETTVVSIELVCDGPPRRGSTQDGGSVNLCPVVDGVSANPSTTTVGDTIELNGAAHDVDTGPSALTLLWTPTGGTGTGTISNPESANPTFTCTGAGTVDITLTATDSDCDDSQSLTVTCTPPVIPRAIVVINEVESNGGVPGDWVELYNAGNAPADLSLCIFKDSDDTHAYVLPSGTTLPAGAYYLLEEATFGFGLGSNDAARLFTPSGTTLIDSYSWTSHATTTYGRCPNGTGSFTTTLTSTKGAANSCADGDGGTGSGLPLTPWPGTNTVVVVDQVNQFSGNLSGLSYDPATSTGPAVMWGIQNSPPTLYRLLWNGTTWASTTTGNWNAGKSIHYTDGTGTPDSEGVTRAELDSTAIYVSTERNADVGTVSRLSVLRYDTSASGASLTATNEWNLTSDLPVSDANLGLEAVSWVPDSFLLGAGFVDESTGQLYDPSRYANHGTGIFFVGLESNGSVYGFALDHVDGTFQRVATFPGGQSSIMDLSFDRDVGYLWGYCDNTCSNRASVFEIDTDPTSPTQGHFVQRRLFDHPSTLPNANNEGIGIAPESECVGGHKAFYWADDSATGGNSLRRDMIPCGNFF